MKRGLRRDAINSFIQSLKKHWKWLALGAVVLIAVLILVIVLILTSSKGKTSLQYLQECLNDQTISKDMVDLVIPANHCNDKELTMLDLSAFKKLKTLSVNGNCFGRVQGLTLSGLSHLERVIVGEDSFSKVAGALSIQECGALRSLSFGDRSFNGFTRLTLSSLSVLESLTIGSECFNGVNDVQLVGFPALKTISVGRLAFAAGMGTFAVKNCDALTEVKVFEGAFGEYNGFEVESLPSLQVLQIDDTYSAPCFPGASLSLQGM